MNRRANLWRDERGAMAVEFALIGPVLFALLVGVLQIGLAMQNYNAMRGAAMDVARHAAVQYQTANKLTNEQLRIYARSVITDAPYNLDGARLTATVTDSPTRVAGTTEKRITYNYSVPTFLSFIGVEPFSMSFSRDVFLLN